MGSLLRCGAMLACGLSLALAWPASPAQTAEPAQRAMLLAQKTRLVEQMLSSPRAQQVAAGSDAEAKQALERARALLAEARQGSDPAATDQRINEALRLATQATRGRSGTTSADEQIKRNVELRAQVDEYRRNIVSTLQARRAEGRSPVLVAVDQHLVEADELSRAARHADAHAAYESAYRVAVQGLSRLRDGETVTIALEFDTPADEYAYEQKRFASHELLVEMTLTERNPVGSMRQAVEQRWQEAKALRDRAADSAAKGEWKSAIAQLEDATRVLIRALQAAGVTGLF